MCAEIMNQPCSYDKHISRVDSKREANLAVVSRHVARIIEERLTTMECI